MHGYLLIFSAIDKNDHLSFEDSSLPFFF